MPGWELADIVVESQRRRYVAQFQVDAQSLRIDVEMAVIDQHVQGARPRGERESAVLMRIIERLHAHTVAGSKHSLLRPVPDGERKHPVHSVEAFHAPCTIGLDQGL